MSSSFLFVGIVAVWAFFLVPRWLRRQHAHPQVEVDVEVDVEFAADYRADDHYYPSAQDYGTYEHAPAAGYDSYSADGYPAAGYAGNGYSAETQQDASASAAQTSRAPLSRSRVLQARRRLLTMLVLLTAVAAACTHSS